MDREKFLLKFEDDGAPFSFNKISEYFYFFRGIYLIAAESLCLIQQVTPEELLNNKNERIELLKPALEYYYGNYPYVDFYSIDLGENELIIDEMQKHSPLEIWALALPTALVMAVIISGGEVDLKSMQFRLPPLGEGLEKLKIALFSDAEILRLSKSKKAKEDIDRRIEEKNEEESK